MTGMKSSINETSENSSSILLKNGTILQHDRSEETVAILRDVDLLIEHDRISQIGKDLKAGSSTLVFDCTNKIIAPGFVDAHHHVWQSQLKGRHGNHTLLDYFPSGNLQYHHFTLDDVFWGQLAGNLELIDSATTTVVDHAHVLTSPDHVTAALNGTIVSGIRSVFCYGPLSIKITRWTNDAFEVDRTNSLPDWFFPQLEMLAQQTSGGNNDRIQLGLFFDSYFMSKDQITDLFGRARNLGVKLITSHFRHFPLPTGQAQIPEILDEAGLLGPDILLSHGNGITKPQAELLKKHGVHLVSTPDAEVFMASGQNPIAFREDLQPLTCLGADCHTVGPGSLLQQMQIALAQDRASQANNAFDQGKYPARMRATVEKAFNLATIRGAKAIGMDSEIGSLHEDKLADIIIFDTLTPAMSCVADQDPLTAIVRHAGIREVDTVIVGGRIRKLQGRLNNINLGGLREGKNLPSGIAEDTERLSWCDVARHLKLSKQNIEKKAQSASNDLAKGVFLKMMNASDALI